jgi:hypothetical protein
MHVLPFVRYMHGSEAKVFDDEIKNNFDSVVVCLSAVPAAQAAPHPAETGHFPVRRPAPRPITDHIPALLSHGVSLSRIQEYRYYRSNDIWVT